MDDPLIVPDCKTKKSKIVKLAVLRQRGTHQEPAFFFDPVKATFRKRRPLEQQNDYVEDEHQVREGFIGLQHLDEGQNLEESMAGGVGRTTSHRKGKRKTVANDDRTSSGTYDGFSTDEIGILTAPIPSLPVDRCFLAPKARISPSSVIKARRIQVGMQSPSRLPSSARVVVQQRMRLLPHRAWACRKDQQARLKPTENPAALAASGRS